SRGLLQAPGFHIHVYSTSPLIGRCWPTEQRTGGTACALEFRQSSLFRLVGRAAFEPGLAKVIIDVVLGDISLAGVAVCRTNEASGDLVEEHLLHRQE